MKFREVRDTEYTKNVSISELYNILNSWNDSKEEDNLFMAILDNAEPTVLFGCAFNTEHRAFRFASSIFIDEDRTPIYYYDVSEKNIGLYGKYSMHNTVVYIKNKLYEQVDEEATIIESEEDLEKFIDKLQDPEKSKNAELRINNICDLVLCEALDYFSEAPYEDAHTATLRLGAEYDYSSEMNKILTLVEDTEGNIKNVNIGLELFDKDLDARLEYLKDKRESLINQIDVD